jgi:hypothetical protein
MGAYVWMSHPDLPDNDPVETPRLAFEARWSRDGWVEVPEPQGPSQADLDATLRPPPDPVAEPAEPDAPASTGGRSAARGKAGPSKGKES